MKAKVLIIVLAAAVVVGCKHGASTDIILDENSINASDVDSGKDEGGDNDGGIDSGGGGDGNSGGNDNHGGNKPGSGNNPNAGHASEPNSGAGSGNSKPGGGGNNGDGGDKSNSGGNDNHGEADSSGGADTGDNEDGKGNGGGNNAHHPVLTTVAEAGEYLANHTGGASRDTAIDLPVRIDLGDMTSPTSGWQVLLGVLDKNDKYVNIDLSACAMSGTEFNYVSRISTGQRLITSIILPDTVESIIAGLITSSAFRNFDSLEKVSGAGITVINDYACSNITTLKAFDFPRLKRINSWAFYECKALTAITLPASVTAIENNAFMACTSLNSVTFEGSIPKDDFDETAFSGNLWEKYLIGGVGTYIRSGNNWTKQP